MSTELVEQFVQTLSRQAMVEVITRVAADDRLTLEFRVKAPPGQKNQHWLLVCYAILLAGGDVPWGIDISRRYFLRAVRRSKKMYYCWRLIVKYSGHPKDDVLNKMIAAINGAPKPAVLELEEIGLYGARYPGGMAGPSGSIPVGPMAIERGRK